MTLPSYEFYTTVYMGDEIPESSFVKFSVRAYDRLNEICMKRLNDTYTDDDAVHKCLCAVAEYLYNVDFAGKNATNPKLGNVKSMSSGGESITFGNTETVYTKAMSDEKVLKKDVIAIAKRYLSDTGLLYWGI